VVDGLARMMRVFRGISTTSLLDSLLTKDIKRDKDPTDQAVRLAAAKLLPNEEFEQLVTPEKQAA
jgi:hypothetical protein